MQEQCIVKHTVCDNTVLDSLEQENKYLEYEIK